MTHLNFAGFAEYAATSPATSEQDTTTAAMETRKATRRSSGRSGTSPAAAGIGLNTSATAIGTTRHMNQKTIQNMLNRALPGRPAANNRGNGVLPIRHKHGGRL